VSFLRNAWYVAAWSSEIESDKLLARRFLNEPVILFREANGAYRALADRCPHRQAPLHMGRFDGTTIQCGYHGLGFDGTGQCVHNPQGAIPRAARVPSYPLVEHHSMLWIWMGEEELAQTTLLPDIDNTGVGCSGWATEFQPAKPSQDCRSRSARLQRACWSEGSRAACRRIRTCACCSPTTSSR
jgi:phenylpropionate dioxygenase-like ring-hydroxylating dioxygenase large terminal subunit